MRALGLALALLAPGCLQLDSEGVPKKNPDFLVVGHRGAPNLAAENTIASYDRALEAGANAIEMDLCVTADGVVVVWHDPDPDSVIALARQEGFEGLLYVPFTPPSGSPLRRSVDTLTLAELRSAYGYALTSDPDVRDPGAPIPTFAEFLAWAKTANGLDAVYLDIKAGSGQGDLAAQIVIQAQAANLGIRLYAMSVHRDVVERLIAEDTTDDLRVVWDHETGGALDDSLELGLRDLAMGLTPLRSESDLFDEIDEATEARKAKQIDSITVWTIDNPSQLVVFMLRDVDAILTDDPGRLYQIWQATL